MWEQYQNHRKRGRYAAEIAVALRARIGEPLPRAARHQTPARGPVDGDFAHETTWLAKVSRAYITPLVRELAHQKLQAP